MSDPLLQFNLRGKDEPVPPLTVVAGFITDVNLLYEIGRLATDTEYSDFHFSRFVLYRKPERLKPPDRLRVGRLRIESPLDLVAVCSLTAAAVGAAIGLFSIFEKLRDRPLQREKLAAEVARQHIENERSAIALRREREANAQPATREDERVQQLMSLLNSTEADNSVELQLLKGDFERRLAERDAEDVFEIVSRRIIRSGITLEGWSLTVDTDPLSWRISPPDNPGMTLRRARERLNLRVRDVEQLTVSIARQRRDDGFAVRIETLSSIENRRLDPSLKQLESLAIVYGLSASQIARWYGVNL